ATEFFNQELTGPFALFTIARLTESIIVVFLLLVNLSGIYSGIASEYRKELSTLRAMGYSDHQRTLSLIRGSLKFSIPTLLAGTAIGLLIAHALLITDGTVLFGHRFVPSLPIQFWILNIVIGHFLMYFGAYIGLKLEDRF
ncbi:MAG: FtsX-like permease family protein, partial [Candidatus Kariarchaeaceae archaeon]